MADPLKRRSSTPLPSEVSFSPERGGSETGRTGFLIVERGRLSPRSSSSSSAFAVSLSLWLLPPAKSRVHRLWLILTVQDTGDLSLTPLCVLSFFFFCNYLLFKGGDITCLWSKAQLKPIEDYGLSLIGSLTNLNPNVMKPRLNKHKRVLVFSVRWRNNRHQVVGFPAS